MWRAQHSSPLSHGTPQPAAPHPTTTHGGATQCSWGRSTEPQILGIGKDLGEPSPIPLLEQEHRDQVTQEHVQGGLGCLQNPRAARSLLCHPHPEQVLSSWLCAGLSQQLPVLLELGGPQPEGTSQLWSEQGTAEGEEKQPTPPMESLQPLQLRLLALGSPRL